MVELKLTIITLNGKTWPVIAQSQYKIHDFIKHFCSIQKLHAGQYSLMFDGRQLNENHKFSQQNIKANSILLLKLKDESNRIKNQPSSDKTIYHIQAVDRYLQQKQGVEQKMLKQHRSLIDEQKSLSQRMISRYQSQKQISIFNSSIISSQKDLMMRQSEILSKNQVQLKILAQNQSNRIAQYQQQIYEYRQRQRRILIGYADQINKQLQLKKIKLIRHRIQVDIHVKSSKQNLLQFQNQVNEQIDKQYKRLKEFYPPQPSKLSNKQKRVHPSLTIFKKYQALQVEELKLYLQALNKQYQILLKTKNKQQNAGGKYIIRKGQSKMISQALNLKRNLKNILRQEQAIVLQQYVQKNIQLRNKLAKKLSQNTITVKNQMQLQTKRLKNQIDAINQSTNIVKERLNLYIKNSDMLFDRKSVNLIMQIKKNVQ